MPPATTEPDPLTIAVAAARKSASILRRAYGQAHNVSHKGLVDLVTEQDKRSEASILRTIRAAFPEHAILAEEGGATSQTSAHRWIVDPLDGTTNYAHGYPVFCVSIAYERAGELEVGVVHDPLSRDLFVARRGHGASLNGRPIHVTSTSTLIESLLETGFPYDRQRLAHAVAQLSHMVFKSQGIRRSGAAALALAWVAAGRLDGFWEAILQPWDCAAGILLIREAGGTVSRIDGTPHRLGISDLAATNGKIHAEMIAELAKV